MNYNFFISKFSFRGNQFRNSISYACTYIILHVIHNLSCNVIMDIFARNIYATFINPSVEKKEQEKI